MRHVYEPGVSGRTWVLFHGTGGTESDLIPWVRSLAPEDGVLGIRGNVSEGGASRYFRRLAEGVFDLDDLRYRANETASFLDQAYAEYGIDAGSGIAIGYSNGANIISAMQFLHPARFRAVALMRPMVPLVPADAPDLSGTHTWMGVGRWDPLSPPGEPDRLQALYLGYGSTVNRYDAEAGHEPTRGDLQSLAEWAAVVPK